MIVNSRKSDDLPVDWQRGVLADFAEVISGHSPKSETYNESGQGVPLINGPAEYGPRFPRVTKWTTAPKRLCRTGDVLFCVRGSTTGRMNEADREYCIGRGVAAIRGRYEKADTRFIQHFLVHVAAYVLAEATAGGSTFPNITDSRLKHWPMTAPPLDEQQAIAAVLGKLRAAVVAQQSIIDRITELKSALMAKFFTEGTRNETQRASQIGLVPHSWKVEPLHNLITIANGQVDPKREPYASMVHIGPEDVEEGTGRLLRKRTAAELGLISGKYRFSPQDIVYSKIRPYLRKAVRPDFIGICSADMYPICSRTDDLTRDWLYHILFSESFTSQATAQQDRTGIPKLNREQLFSILIPVPSPPEQGQITRALDVLDKWFGEANRQCALHVELFSAMLDEVMTGRIRVGHLNLHELGVSADA
ncbi:MAG TPA: restriction endonuclease subunit S [Pirellulales bacterium]|jgi:type I restriction enzyme S subunit|nr:restriction endonuclease subunit S [Pirellulales bacterium]